MDNPILQIAMRYLHVVSFTAMVGGMVFVSLALRPGMKLLEVEQREAVQKRIHDAFLRVVYWSIGGLIVSGIYNWWRLNPEYNRIPGGQALIGSKTLLAAILFFIIWGRSVGLIKLPGKACHMINLHLAAIIMLLGAILRYLRLNAV